MPGLAARMTVMMPMRSLPIFSQSLLLFIINYCRVSTRSLSKLTVTKMNHLGIGSWGDVTCDLYKIGSFMGGFHSLEHKIIPYLGTLTIFIT